jgi:hypothetical protein
VLTNYLLGELCSGVFDPCVGSTGTILVLRSYPHALSANAATNESSNAFMINLRVSGVRAGQPQFREKNNFENHATNFRVRR